MNTAKLSALNSQILTLIQELTAASSCIRSAADKPGHLGSLYLKEAREEWLEYAGNRLSVLTEEVRALEG